MIDRLIRKQPDITIDEIIRKLRLYVCNKIVRKAVMKLGYVRKKKTLYTSEWERSRCEREKRPLGKIISEVEAYNLVFLDESGININMTRLYARTVGGERAVYSVPLNTQANTAVLSSIRLSGETVYATYKCALICVIAIIDSDTKRFTIELLSAWKQNAE